MFRLIQKKPRRADKTPEKSYYVNRIMYMTIFLWFFYQADDGFLCINRNILH